MFRRDNGSNRSNGRPASHSTSTANDAAPVNGSARPSTSKSRSGEKTEEHHHHLPLHHGKKRTKGIKADGESGRSGIHPFRFLGICFRSSCTLSMVVNVLWPLVPAAIAVHFVEAPYEKWYRVVFILNYLALIPCANLIGFAGQELARKLPKVAGVLTENFVGGVTELIIFIVLTYFAAEGSHFATGFSVVKAAIMGSILANMLLCLGACFIAGGFNRVEQSFHEIMSETGSGLMLVAGIALVAPTIFTTVLENQDAGDVYQLGTGVLNNDFYEGLILNISRATAIVLLMAFVVYLIFQTTSHHSIYDDVFEYDEQNDRDRHKDLSKAKLTFTECVIALVIGAAGVALTATFLVLQIDAIVEQDGVSDGFMGLILVPLVEKAAEHLTAVDEAYDNQPNLVLAHILGGSIQTALFNAPFAVIFSWGLHTGGYFCSTLDLNFRYFEAILLILGILVVGNFLRDGKSNYLEGSLLLFTYVIIAVCAFYIPNSNSHGDPRCSKSEEGGTTAAVSEGGGAEPTTQAVARLVSRALLG